MADTPQTLPTQAPHIQDQAALSSCPIASAGQPAHSSSADTGETRSKPDYEIVHNTQAGQWEVRLRGTDTPTENPVIGYASYDFYDNAILMTHTVVRREYSGMGIAADLVRTALAEIREQGEYSVVPVCSYVQSFIEKNPKYQELLPKKDMEPGLRLGD